MRLWFVTPFLVRPDAWWPEAGVLFVTPFLVSPDAWCPEAGVGLPMHGCGNLHKGPCMVVATCTQECVRCHFHTIRP